ncbi:MAG: class IV adenylate cyclase [Alphaproteobacteria bacterium]
MLEAEVKLALTPEAHERLLERLASLGATGGAEHRQSDAYLAHPARDFAATDEALRLRTDGDELRLTYKGRKLDPPRKTREEIEFGLATDPRTASLLFERLGFSPVATVAKRRVEWHLAGPDRAVVSIDEVEGLGLFCEVEVAADDVASGRDALERALRRLGLDGARPIAESYLELLLRPRREPRPIS